MFQALDLGSRLSSVSSTGTNTEYELTCVNYSAFFVKIFKSRKESMDVHLYEG